MYGSATAADCVERSSKLEAHASLGTDEGEGGMALLVVVVVEAKRCELIVRIDDDCRENRARTGRFESNGVLLSAGDAG